MHPAPDFLKVTDAPKGADSHGDIHNARAFAGMWRGVLLYVTDRHKWLLWDKGLWRLCEKGEEIKCAKAVCADLYASAGRLLAKDADKGKRMAQEAISAHKLPRIKAMVELASSEPEMATTTDRLDADPYLLGVENGVVDLRSGNLLPNQPKLLITRTCAASYLKEAECPRWLKFLDEVFEGDAETIKAVQLLLGMTLIGTVIEELLVICIGFGANGKSVFANVIGEILSTYAKTAPSTILTARRSGDSSARNDLAALAGARYASINELQAGARLDEQVVKALAGREPIAARFLYGEYFDFLPTFTPWLRTNHKPIVTGDDDGIWRRLVILPFRRKFNEDEQDPHLEAKLLAERDGILRWMVEGAEQYRKHGLKLSATMRAEQASYRKDSDLLGEFLDEKFETDINGKVERSTLFFDWRIWCEGNGVQAGSHKTFTQRLAERGFRATQSNGKRLYAGLTLRPRG
jgi:putative DNA primase/helicase